MDLAKAHVKALDISSKKNLKAEPVNLGTGTYSVKEVLEAFEKENNIKVNTHYGNRRKGDVEAIYADPSYAYELLNWKAELGLKEMVTSVWNWQKTLSKNLVEIIANAVVKENEKLICIYTCEKDKKSLYNFKQTNLYKELQNDTNTKILEVYAEAIKHR